MGRTCFYEEGLRFECTACGDCCRTHGDGDEYAFVYLSDRDVSRISSHLGMSTVAFLNAYCATDDNGDIHLAGLTGDCAFLEAGKRCRVYPVRPMQCRTWPFWKENLVPSVWEGPVTDCCPGIGQGRLYTKQEILALCRSRDDWYAADDAAVIPLKKA